MNAVEELSLESGRSITVNPALLGDRQSRAVQGPMSARQALVSMINDPMLDVAELSDGSLAVTRNQSMNLVSQNADEPFDLGTLIINARRFDEPDIDVPFSTSVVTPETTEIAPSSRVSEVVQNAPNVNFSNPGAPRFTQFNIRGAGALNLDAPDDTSVGTYVNGVPIPRQAADFQLLDIQQVEILRGPQGTLFGDNSSAGVINVITRPAPDAAERELRFSFDSEENSSVKFLFGDRVSDRLAYRIVGGYNNRAGFIPDATQGVNVGELDELALRATFFAEFSDTVSGEFVLDHNSFDTDHPSWVWRDAPDGPTASQAEFDSSEQTSTGASAKLTFNLDAFELQTITSFRRIDADVFTDNIDFLLDAGLPFAAPGSAFTTLNDETQDVFFQEFLFRDETSRGLRWQAGLNFKLNQLDTTFTNVTEDPAFPGFPFTDTTNTTIDSKFYSVFGEVDVPVSETVTLSFGARYSIVERDADVNFNGFGLTFADAGDTSFSGWSGRASLAYAPTLDNNYYATLSRGWKPGGFQRFQSNISSTGRLDPTYDETTSVSFEIGNKRRFMDGRAALDFALFYTDAEDEQAVAFDFTTFQLQIENADVRTKGFELEGSYDVTDRFTIGGGIGYTDAEFTSSNAVAGVVSGNQVPNAPLWSVGLNANYTAPVNVFGRSADWVSSLAVIHRSDRQADISNSLTLDDYTVVNVSTGIETDNWGARLFVRNLFDETYETSAILNPNGRVGVVEAPERSVGFEISARW
mgnify:CR=1 FL=1